MAQTGPPTFPAPEKKPDLCRIQVYDTDTASYRFHFSNFRYYLTLFSKFFASFPHGTCSLSVSHQYLALDGIYHPLRAAVPNNSTRRKRTVRVEDRHERGYHPPRRSVPRDLTRLRPLVSLLQTTIPKIFSLSFSRFSRPY